MLPNTLPNALPNALPNSQLVETLFRPSAASPMPAEQAAVANACRRWPELSAMVRAAAELVEAGCVCEIPGAPQASALIKQPGADWQHGVVGSTPTGFGCTCRAWPPEVRTGPGDGRYCPDILAYLLMLYLKRPPAPFPHTPETLWHLTLAELQPQMLRATYDLWLAGTSVVSQASSPTRLTVAARDRMACEWLARRLHPVVLRTVRGIAGYPIDVGYVVG